MNQPPKPTPASSSIPPNPWSSPPQTSRFQPRPPSTTARPAPPASVWSTPGGSAKLLASNPIPTAPNPIAVAPRLQTQLPAPPGVIVAPSTPGPSEKEEGEAEADGHGLRMPLDLETPDEENGPGGGRDGKMDSGMGESIGEVDEGTPKTKGVGMGVTREEFLSLLDRVSRTESTLSNLTSQVATLSVQLSSLQQSSSSTTTTPTPTPSSSTPNPTSNGTDHHQQLLTLTHQVTALSTSVAQLQRMQSSSVRAGMERVRSGGVGSGEEEDVQGQAPEATTGGTAIGTGSSSNIAALSSLGVPNLRPSSSTFQPFQQSSPNPSTSNAAPNQSALMTHHLQRNAAAAAVAAGPPGVKRPMTPRSGMSYQGGGGGSGGSPTPGGGGGGVNANNLHQLGSLGVQRGGRPGLGRSVSGGGPMGVNSGDGWGGGNGNGNGTGGGGAGGGPGGLSLGSLLPSLPPIRSNDPPTPNAAGGGPGLGAGPGGLMVNKWEHLALSGEVLRMIGKYGIGPPNKIQSRALPFMLKGMDIIAQAPPTQERIIAYVVPVVQMCLNLGLQQTPYKGPNAVMITTTVDQATQAHKLIRDLGAPLGIRSSLLVGAGGADLSADVRMMLQTSAQVVVGTPARVHDLFVKHGGSGGIGGGEVRMLVLDEVDQLIARNLYEYVVNVVKLFPAPRTRTTAGGNGNLGVIGTPAIQSPGGGSPFDPGMSSPFNPSSQTPFPGNGGRFAAQQASAAAVGAVGSGNGTSGSSAVGSAPSGSGVVDRQTCLFSNTIPTDVINFSQAIQVREPVRVLVRREGGASQPESGQSGALRHYYLYLALATNSRAEQTDSGPGTIGSGRSQGQSAAAPESNPAREWKLEALADLLEDYPGWQAIVHVGSQSTLEAVVNKLNSRQLETVYLMPDMVPALKQATLTKWRLSGQTGRGPRFLVAFDLVIKTPEVPPSPLVINFDLPRSVEGYAQRVAAASTSKGQGPSSVILNFILPNGGDVEMLRSTECAYRFKCSEIPSSIRDLF